MQIIHSEQQRIKRLQTRNRASGSYEIPSKGVYAIGVSKGDETVWCQKKKKKKEKMTESATNLTKEKLINPISSVSLKQDKLREINA